jgi:hypothetical protein
LNLQHLMAQRKTRTKIEGSWRIVIIYCLQ